MNECFAYAHQLMDVLDALLFVVLIILIVCNVIFYYKWSTALDKTASMEIERSKLLFDLGYWRSQALTYRPHRTPLTPEELEQRSDEIKDTLDEHNLI